MGRRGALGKWGTSTLVGMPRESGLVLNRIADGRRPSYRSLITMMNCARSVSRQVSSWILAPIDKRSPPSAALTLQLGICVFIRAENVVWMRAP